jgi:hypothetical protein
LRQCPTAGIESPTSRAIAVFEVPAAEASTMRARRANPCGAVRDRTKSLRLARSVSVSSISCLRGRPMLLLLLPWNSLPSHRTFCPLFLGHYT